MIRRLLLVALTLLAVACGGGGGGAKSPRTSGVLPQRVQDAFKLEESGDFGRAITAYAEVVRLAANAPDDPYSVPAAVAALDALVDGDVLAFGDVASSSALVQRMDAGARKKVDDALATAEKEADGPFVRGLIARTRLNLVERAGDVRAATDFRARYGCAREATLVGPTSYPPVSGVVDAGPFANATAPLPANVPGPGPFKTRLEPMRVAGLGCFIPLYAATTVPGVRDVIVDVKVPKAGVIGLRLVTRGAATLRAGGKPAITREYSLGQGAVPRLARVQVDKPGTLRLVARVGMEQDFMAVELSAWDDEGKPLEMHAPSAGQAATTVATSVTPLQPPNAKTDAELLTVALSQLAVGENRSAESLLHAHASRQDVPPELLLVYARAVRGVRDLPAVKWQERARTAYDRVLEAAPESWEAVIEHSVLA
jgi:hypothetical protein